MLENVIITNQGGLERAKAEMKKAGANGLHILTDFDRTLVKAFVNGQSVPSLISILRDGHYLTPDYAPKAHALFNKYRAIELDYKIPQAEKKKAMEQWWTEHFNLIIKSGLTEKEVGLAMQSPLIQFREGFSRLADFLNEKNIPLVIMSSSGLGIEAIKLCLDRAGKLFGNVCIISNAFIWDENGQAIGVKQPIIHSLNKNETSLKNFPEIFAKIENRKNVILLGDNAEDTAMIEGFAYENLLKIGFLNERIGENLEHYQSVFDAIISNDGSLDFLNQLLHEIAA